MSSFVKSTILTSSDGVSFTQENNINFAENRMNFAMKPNVKIKSIQEQIKENNEKNNQSNPFLGNTKDLKSDTLASVLDYSEPLNIDEDYEYFQFYGQKRQETESGWKEQQIDDMKKFKEARAKLIINEDNKNQLSVYVSKEKKNDNNINNIEKSKFKPKIKILKKENIVKDEIKNNEDKLENNNKSNKDFELEKKEKKDNIDYEKKNNLRKMLEIDSPIKKKIKIEGEKLKKVLLLDYD